MAATTAVFDDFSFSVRRGEILAIIGPSGGGKTTLLYLLAGLRLPRSGRVSINGDHLWIGHARETAWYCRTTGFCPGPPSGTMWRWA